MRIWEHGTWGGWQRQRADRWVQVTALRWGHSGCFYENIGLCELTFKYRMRVQAFCLETDLVASRTVSLVGVLQTAAGCLFLISAGLRGWRRKVSSAFIEKGALSELLWLAIWGLSLALLPAWLQGWQSWSVSWYIARRFRTRLPEDESRWLWWYPDLLSSATWTFTFVVL